MNEHFTCHHVKALLLGLAVGDALGVPAEFNTRQTLDLKPIDDMTGYGTHHQPPGTWSDDTSLTLALADALITNGYDLTQIAENFIRLYQNDHFTPHGRTFGTGQTTRRAIQRLIAGTPPTLAGDSGERHNGNGSLMRIAPMIFETYDDEPKTRFQKIHEVSAITHRHPRSIIACTYFVNFAQALINKLTPDQAYQQMQTLLPSSLKKEAIDNQEISLYHRLLEQDISNQPREKISSTGYVLHTLEAAIWCLLTSNSYAESVLKAVNLGDDTDTTAAVTGALAALHYGLENIPIRWIHTLAKHKEIEETAEKLCANYRK